MKAEAESKPYDDINITPMLDLAYVLLVIFIIMTTASVQGLRVSLPKSSNTPSQEKPKTKSIVIGNDGRIFYENYPVTLDDLEQKLRSQQASDPETPYALKSDGGVQYKLVVDVIALMGKLQISQIALASGGK